MKKYLQYIISLTLLFLVFPVSAQLLPDWEQNYGDTIAGNQNGNRILRDNQGNIIVASTTNLPQLDNVLLKYDSLGNLLWNQVYPGTTGFSNFFTDLVIDKFDNIYITGQIYVSSTWQGVLIKYNSQGNLLWDTTYLYPPASSTGFSDIVIGKSGDLYVTGFENEQISDVLIMRYDTSGNQLWTEVFSSPDRKQMPLQIAADSSENIFVCGEDWIWPILDKNVFILKFDSSGSLIWNTTFADSASQEESFGDFLIDGESNLYLSGSTFIDSIRKQDGFVAKYDSSGNFLQLYLSDDTLYRYNYGGPLCLIEDTIIYCSVKNTDNSNNYGSANWMRLDSSLNMQWMQTFDDTGMVTEEFVSALPDPTTSYLYLRLRKVYFTPTIHFSQTILEESLNGTTLSVSPISDSSFTHDANDMIVAGEKNIYVTGSIHIGNNADCYTAHYKSDTLTTVPEKKIIFPLVIYPVPASEIIHIANTFPENVSLTCTINDVSGKTLKRFLFFNGNEIYTGDLKSGFYFIELKNQKEAWHGKFVIQM